MMLTIERCMDESFVVKALDETQKITYYTATFQNLVGALEHIAYEYDKSYSNLHVEGKNFVKLTTVGSVCIPKDILRKD